MVEYITTAGLVARAQMVEADDHLPRVVLTIVVEYLHDMRGIEILRQLHGKKANKDVNWIFIEVACDAFYSSGWIQYRGPPCQHMIQNDTIGFCVRYAVDNCSWGMVTLLTLKDMWDFICGRPNGQINGLIANARKSAEDQAKVAEFARMKIREQIDHWPRLLTPSRRDIFID